VHRADGDVDLGVCSADKHVAGPRAGVFAGRADLVADIASRAYELGLDRHAALEAIDYYTLLGVARRHDREELRDAYYRFADSMHPDNFREAAAELRDQVHCVFKRAAEAYRVLGDPVLREQYDEGLEQGAVRLRAIDAGVGARASRLPEPSFRSLIARQLWRQAKEAEDRGDLKGAKLQLVLVLGHEPDNADVEWKLQEVSGRIRGPR